VANIKSQIKRNKQNEKRRLRNRTLRGSARTAVKSARNAMLPGADAKTEVTTAISALDRAAEKGGIHPKNAARRKSRLMKAMVKAASLPAEAADKKKTSGKKK
jgi:small subunit ribosomal protein S20